LDRTRWPELLVGLERVRVLEVARDGDGRLHVAIETTDELVACGECGVRAKVKDRDPVGFADLPTFGAPVQLVWIKRRRSCREQACGEGTWTEQRPDIAPARAAMTTRAGMWVTREVGAEVHTVAYIARQLGVAWHSDGRGRLLGPAPHRGPRPGRCQRGSRGGRDQVPGCSPTRADPVGHRDLRHRRNAKRRESPGLTFHSGRKAA
jgi:hypothetical protein